MAGDADPDRQEYGRYGNPTVIEVERRVAALDGAEDALLFASGMAAVTTAVLALVKAGDHVVLFRDGYRRTRQFVVGCWPASASRTPLVEPASLDGLEQAIEPPDARRRHRVPHQPVPALRRPRAVRGDLPRPAGEDRSSTPPSPRRSTRRPSTTASIW